MGTRRKSYESGEKDVQKSSRKVRPALTEEARENQLIALATDLAEQRLLDGTASNQLIVHYLRLGSPTARLEREILEKQKELISAKTEAMQSAKRSEDLYANALAAMKEYKGGDDDEREYPDNY